MSTTDLAALIREGNLAGAMAGAKDLVRKQPAVAAHRVLLFQLFTVDGEWDKALTQLEVVGELDKLALPMVQAYREVLRCEALRASVFAGQRSPMVFGDPEPWVALLLEALRASAAGKYAEAAALREQVFEQAPATAGSLDGEPFEFGGFAIETTPLCHPGRTFGYRIRPARGAPSIAYVTDNELRGTTPEGRAALIRFLRGVTVMIHDAMYSEVQAAARAGWGHSSAAEAVRLALDAEVNQLVLFHHDPERDDDALERLLEEAETCRVHAGGRLRVTLAAEGDTIPCREAPACDH